MTKILDLIVFPKSKLSICSIHRDNNNLNCQICMFSFYYNRVISDIKELNKDMEIDEDKLANIIAEYMETPRGVEKIIKEFYFNCGHELSKKIISNLKYCIKENNKFVQQTRKGNENEKSR